MDTPNNYRKFLNYIELTSFGGSFSEEQPAKKNYDLGDSETKDDNGVEYE